LDAVAHYSGIHSLRYAFGRAKPGNLGRLQMETQESGFVENKGVPACKRIVASQFPIGDDVSALHPLRSSVSFVFSYTDADETDRRSALRYCAGVV
jgi:hypothetical protein